MAAVANQAHSTAQKIGARIVWNPSDAATQPPRGTRERVLNFSDPWTDHRNLGGTRGELVVVAPCGGLPFEVPYQGQEVEPRGRRQAGSVRYEDLLLR